MGIVVVVAASLGFIQVISPSSAVELYFESSEINDYAKEVQEDRDRTLKVARSAAVSNSLVLGWISSVPGYVIGGVQTVKQIEEAAFEIVDQLVEHRRHLFGMTQSDELWNFAVYLYDRHQDRLFPIVRAKHPDHPGSEKGRTFKPGQGHIGKAFSDRVTKITGDADAPDVRNLMDAANDMKRDYDIFSYRSYASVPIGTDQVDGRPFGVIVATSNHAKRFKLDNSNVLRLAASVLANVIELTQYDFQGPSTGDDGQPPSADG